MQITIFAKKRTTKEGKPFFVYISTLTKKDGTTQTVTVKFRDECGAPKPEKCPMNIKFPREAANISSEEYTQEDGTLSTSYKLWISEWEVGEAYVDHSLDEYV